MKQRPIFKGTVEQIQNWEKGNMRKIFRFFLKQALANLLQGNKRTGAPLRGPQFSGRLKYVLTPENTGSDVSCCSRVFKPTLY